MEECAKDVGGDDDLDEHDRDGEIHLELVVGPELVVADVGESVDALH